MVYDCKLRRPACALLQAVLGGDDGACTVFDSRHWLLSPTPDMRLYEVDQDRLRDLISITEQANPRNEETPPER